MHEKEMTTSDGQDANLGAQSGEPNSNEVPTKVQKKDGIRLPGWWLVIIGLYLWLIISMMMEKREDRARLISMGETVHSWSNFEQLSKDWGGGLMRGLEGTFYYSAGVLVIPGPLLILGILIHLPSKDYSALRGLFLGTAIIMLLHPLLEYLIGPI